MSRKNKKKGSSLVVVIIVMAILFTTGTSILTVTASDYKMRVNESKKIRNLYEADSGLDVIENIIIKTSEQAIKYADITVREQLASLTEEERQEENLNDRFKDLYNRFLRQQVTYRSENYDLIEYLVKNKKIIDSIDASGNYNYIEQLTDAIIDVDYLKSNDEITMVVKSTFETVDGEFRNQKTVETKYIVTAPEYNAEVDSKELKKPIDIYPVFDDKIISADGNLDITGKIEISGDVWVKGNPQVISNPLYTFDKYRGGVKIAEGELKLVGNLFTANSLSLKNNAKVNVTQNVYALNAYVGKESSGTISENNYLQVNGDLIVNNDLALNAINSTISIKNNFYGINDKNTENINTAEKALKSSSIIVNETSENSNSTLTVDGKSYIMGVAYINAKNDLGEDYQTGESVAVKGNYIAYSQVLPGYENRVNIQYYNPLQLVDSIDGDSTIEKKAEYFKKYYETNGTLKNGGVDLKGTVHSVGAYIQGNTSYYLGLTEKALNDVSSVKSDYKRNVFAMGDMTGTSDDIESVDKIVDTQINFNEIMDNFLNYDFNTTLGQVILNKDITNVIELDGDSIIFKDGDGNIIGRKYGKAGLIITNGNVVINSNVDFTGNIIALGNINVVGDNNKLTYDENTTRGIVAINYEELKNIFLFGDKKQSIEINVGEQIKISGNKEYDKKSYLQTSNWRIVK